MANYTLKTDGTLEEALRSVISACNSTETAVNKTYADTVSYIQGALSKAAISADSTDEQFPTAKKVYQFVTGQGYLPKTAGEGNKVTGKLYLTNGLDLTGDLITKGSIKLPSTKLEESASGTVLARNLNSTTIASKLSLNLNEAILEYRNTADGQDNTVIGEVKITGTNSYIRFGTTQMAVTGNTFTFKNTASGGKTVTLDIASTDIKGTTDTVALRGWVEKRLTEVAGETVTNAVTTSAEFSSAGNILVVSEASSRKVAASTAKITTTVPSLNSNSGDIPTVRAICGTIKNAVANMVTTSSVFPASSKGRLVIVSASSTRMVEAYSANITNSAPALDSSSVEIPRVVDICGTIKNAVAKMVVADAQFTEAEVGRIVVVAGKDSRSVKAYSANITNAEPIASSTSTDIPRVVDICKTIRTYAQPLNSKLTDITELEASKGYLYNVGTTITVREAVQPVISSFESGQILVANVDSQGWSAKTTGYSIRDIGPIAINATIEPTHILSYADLVKAFLPISSSSGGGYTDDINIQWNNTVNIAHGSSITTHTLTKDRVSLFGASVIMQKQSLQLVGTKVGSMANSGTLVLGYKDGSTLYSHSIQPYAIDNGENKNHVSYCPPSDGFLAHELEIFMNKTRLNGDVNNITESSIDRSVNPKLAFDSGMFIGSYNSTTRTTMISGKKPCAITTGASDNPTDLMVGGLWIYPA